jgi:hypothetical protein
MQCAQCGTENEALAKFCAVCGSPLGAPEPTTVVPGPEAAPAPVVFAPVAPQPAPAYAPPPPPRRKRGCLITALVLASILAILSAAAVWFITRPPRDLGVSYTEVDYQAAIGKFKDAGVTIEDTVPNLPVEQTKLVYSPIKKKVSVRLNTKEVSAAVSMHHRSPKWALSDVQIKLGDKDQAEMSGYAIYNGTRYAFYADVNALFDAASQTVGGKANKIVVFGLDFPQQWYSVAEQYLIQRTNDWLKGMGEGLDIQTARIEGGELVLEGSVPEYARRVALDAVNATGTPGP